MGIIDDYYGGYENLAMFTNYETGDVDFESAYNLANFGEGFSFPNVDSDEFADEEEKAEFYRVAGAIARDMYGPGGSMGNGNSSSRKASKSSRSGRKQGKNGGQNTAATATTATTASAAVGEPVPGWEAAEQCTMSGQQLFAGKCSSCGEQCTVPFRPVQGRAPPCCRSCHNSSKSHSS